jgi:putative sigma-54 modulation protein
MQINIKATKMKLTPAIRDYVQKKMDMLEKYLGNFKVLHCEVEIGMAVGSHQSGDIYRAEINLELPGELLRVEKEEEDLYKAIDKVKDHMSRSIKKYKEKKMDKKKKGE